MVFRYECNDESVFTEQLTILKMGKKERNAGPMIRRFLPGTDVSVILISSFAVFMEGQIFFSFSLFFFL